MRCLPLLPVVVLCVAAALVGEPGSTSRAAAERATPAATKKCLPLGGLLVRKTIRRARDDGSEVTERLGHGVYRVTRCREDGRLRVSMTVAPVRDPDGQRVLAPALIVRADRITSLDYGDPDDPRWARAWRRVRERVRDSIIPATEGTPRPEPRATASQGAECDDGKFTGTGASWPDNKHPWRWHKKSFGGNANTLESLKRANGAWNKTKTNCNLDDITEIAAPYQGTTTARATEFDGVSVVDKGDIDAVDCPGALACALTRYTTEGDTVEADVRFSDAVKWSNSGKAGAYDYRAVATHEFGHVIGLADLYDNPKLTMTYAVSTGSTAARSLGRGDVRGLRQIYD